MKIETLQVNDIKIAEVVSENIVIASKDDGLELMGNLYYQGYDKIIIYEKNITPEFFDLKTGIAGEILQKFSNYRIRLAIVGDFTSYRKNSLKDFIFESNKIGRINFVGSKSEAIDRFLKR
jgi:hypothetical protein